MKAAVLIVLATALLGAATDAVVESAIDGGDAIVMFGQPIATPGTAGTLGILTATSAAAVLAWVAAIAHARGRRLEHRLTEELDERWEDLSQKVAGELGRKTLLEWRVVELRNQVDELVTKRDELLEEMNAVRERTSELQRMIRQQREAALALAPAGETPSEATETTDAEEAEAVKADAATEGVRPDEVVVLPEVGHPAGMRAVDAEDEAEPIEEAAPVGATEDDPGASDTSDDEVISVVEPEPALSGDAGDEAGGSDDVRPWR